MFSTQGRKNKIELTDYNYKRDIKNRILLQKLTTFEVEVLKEIVYNSLSFPLHDLTTLFAVDNETLMPVLEKLGQTGLFEVKENILSVDKDLRRYYEAQIEKFDEDFSPDMEFIFSLLNQVPIHVLPQWYSLSKSTDDIFNSIVEKYFSTPKIYQNYLREQVFDSSSMQAIMKDVFSSESLKVSGQALRDKYNLSREEFEECMLHLEFNFICYLTYVPVDGIWEEYVTPFHEWREYKLRSNALKPKQVDEVDQIEKRHSRDFGFIEDMTKLLKEFVENGPVKLSVQDQEFLLPEDKMNMLTNVSKNSKYYQKYNQSLVNSLRMMDFIEITGDYVSIKDNAKEWMSKPIQNRAMTYYFHSINRFRQQDTSEATYNDRDIREVEKALKSIVNDGWVFFDEFASWFTAPIGGKPQVSLVKKGRRWQYQLPTYNSSDIEFVKNSIINHLFESGMVSIGEINGKDCFQLTPFGRMSLCD